MKVEVSASLNAIAEATNLFWSALVPCLEELVSGIERRRLAQVTTEREHRVLHGEVCSGFARAAHIAVLSRRRRDTGPACSCGHGEQEPQTPRRDSYCSVRRGQECRQCCRRRSTPRQNGLLRSSSQRAGLCFYLDFQRIS